MVREVMELRLLELAIRVLPFACPADENFHFLRFLSGE